MPANTTNNQAAFKEFWQSGSIPIAALGAAFAALLTFFYAPQPRNELPPVEAEIAETTVEPTAPARDVMRAAFYDQEVQPRIDETDALNRQSADRCVQRLRGVVDRYRDGVAPFVEDLTSMSTRLGIVRRLPGDWWKDDKRIEAYVQKKFEHHLFSKEKLMNDIAKVLDDFRAEVDANQKRMLVQIHASLTTADLPEVNLEEYEPFFDSVATQLKNSSATQGTNSVYRGLTILVASEVGSYVSVTIVSGLLARFGTAAAATAAVGVGTTAGAAATGAGGGSLAGPVGTVVGLGVGLAVGLIVDWWMTEQFEEKMVNQMQAYLDSLENALLAGSASASLSSPESTEQRDGVADALPVLCDQLLTAYRERFFQQIVTVQQP